MDRTDVAAQQARLAEYRKQQEHTKQPSASTSAAKETDAGGQAFKEVKPLKPEFQKAHDHAIDHSEKKGPLVSPQLREQDAARATPAGMNGPTPPQSTGTAVNRQAMDQRLSETNRQAKSRQQQADRGMMKNGKDQDGKDQN